ncbi:MAG: hypothetical protein ACYC8T_28135, partial [Myxococcaceae bacterium]
MPAVQLHEVMVPRAGIPEPPAEPDRTEPRPSFPEPPAEPDRTQPRARIPEPPAEPDPTNPRALVPVRPGRVAPRPRPQGRPPTRRGRGPEPKQGGGRKLVLFSVLLLAAAGVAGGVWMKRSQVPKVVAPLGPSAHEQAATAFQLGKNLAREGKWAQAQARFQEAQGLDAELPGLDDYLRRCATEIPNQEHLTAANAALDKELLGEAAAELKLVAEDTVQLDPLGKMRKKLDDRFSARMTDGRALAASPHDLAAQRKLDALAADLLAARPGDRDAKALLDQAKANIARLTRRGPEVKAPEGPGPWVEVASRFKSGDVTGAFAVANECAGAEANCRALVTQLTEFQDLNKKVESLDVRGLERLVQLEQVISGGSVAAGPARTRLATQYYKMASSANQTGQWGRAWEYAAKVLAFDRTHAG